MSNIITVKSMSKLKVENNNIVIVVNEETNKVPINQIEVLIIENPNCSITASVNIICAKYSVPIIYCDQKYTPLALTTSFHTFYKQLSRLEKQIKWKESRKQKLFMKIIEQKIDNQLLLLEHFNKDQAIIRKIKCLKLKITKDNFISIEAQVARIYFKELYTNKFIRFAEDEINYGLNYGYAILRSVIKQQIVAKGLSPALGIWHSNQFNNFNLADDLIEVYRPMVDYVVYLLMIKDNIFTKVEKEYLQQLIFQTVVINNQKKEYKTSVQIFINNIIDYLNYDIKKIDLPVTNCEHYEY